MKRRKLLMLLPFFLLPTLIIGYLIYKFKNDGKDKQARVNKEGSQFNKTLPSPEVEDKEKNKLEIYLRAQQDSIVKMRQAEKPMPNFYDPVPAGEIFVEDTLVSRKQHNLTYQEQKASEQLKRIERELNNTTGSGKDVKTESRSAMQDFQPSPDITKLEQLMSSMQGDTSMDPEMERLNSMLDKLIQIQSPPKLKMKIDSIIAKSVSSEMNQEIPVSGFYGLDPAPSNPAMQKAAISAIVHTDQTLQNGSTIKLRLLQNVYIDQFQIPMNTFVYGVCNITNERLYVEVDKIAFNNFIFPVKLQVYDLDGILGINVPGAVTRDVAKEGLDQGFQSLDPSISAQVASAGIQSIRSLVSKKTRAVRATVKAGHQVLLQ